MGVAAVAVIALEELAGELPRLPRASLEALAEHAHAARLGPGPAGLAVGQGVRVLVVDLPRGIDGARSPDGVLCVRAYPDPAHQALVVLHELAHHMLDAYDHTHADVWELALALGAPGSLLRRLQREGRLTSVHVAAESGLPVLAAAWRVGVMEAEG